MLKYIFSIISILFSSIAFCSLQKENNRVGLHIENFDQLKQVIGEFKSAQNSRRSARSGSTSTTPTPSERNHSPHKNDQDPNHSK